jgi:ribonucleoside-diphosphate reductase alpha chain
MDCELTNGFVSALPSVLEELRDHARETNKEWSQRLNINESSAITCVKPSGTVSQLCDSASGIHSRHSEYYIRTVRSDLKDPITKLMIDQGVPHEPDVMNPADMMVFSFPIKSPEGAFTRDNRSAISQLEFWKVYQEHWCEHKPSVTVTVKEDEWTEVGSWVYNNFNVVSGISFLPHSDHVYQQAPYQDCTEAEYKELEEQIPVLDWSKLSEYESEDYTTASQELACVGNSCEL